MEELDFTKEPWKNIQFRVKTLEELEEFYGHKLDGGFQAVSYRQTFLDTMYCYMGKPFKTTINVIQVWMGIEDEVSVDEFNGYFFVREWITHNKTNDGKT